MYNYNYKGLIHFTLPYNIFCILPIRVQNWAMYSPTFIIACNVHFLRDDANFFNKMTYALHVIESKLINFLGLLHFTPQHRMHFIYCSLEFQNQTMYPLSFIIVCNVHFLRDDVFLYIEKYVISTWMRAKWSIF